MFEVTFSWLWTFQTEMEPKKRAGTAPLGACWRCALCRPEGRDPLSAGCSRIGWRGPLSSALLPFFGGLPYENRLEKKGTLILASLLEDLGTGLHLN